MGDLEEIRLRFREVALYPSSHGIPTAGISWCNVTHINVTALTSPSILHAIFRQCRHLADCTVYISSPVTNDHGQYSDMPNIVLPYLRQLEVFYANADSEVLQPLVLPALRNLESNLAQNVTSFEALASSFHLMKFSHRYAHPPDVSRLLTLTPSVLDLTISDTSLLALSRMISDYGIVLELEVLNVGCRFDAPEPLFFKVIIKFLESRWWPGPGSSKLLNGSTVSRIKQVVLDSLPRQDLPSYPPERFFELIEQCKREGLEITY